MGLREIVACACLSVWPVMAAAAQPAQGQTTPEEVLRTLVETELAARDD